MLGRTHIVAATLTGLCISKVMGLPFNETLLCVNSMAIGSIFPDIDKQTSIMGNRFRVVSFLISLIYKHRALFHAPLVYIALYLVLCGIYPSSINSFSYIFVGVFSHLLLDSLTIDGIPLLYPFIKKNYGLRMIRTGGGIELILRWSMNTALCYITVIQTPYGNQIMSFAASLIK